MNRYLLPYHFPLMAIGRYFGNSTSAIKLSHAVVIAIFSSDRGLLHLQDLGVVIDLPLASVTNTSASAPAFHDIVNTITDAHTPAADAKCYRRDIELS